MQVAALGGLRLPGDIVMAAMDFIHTGPGLFADGDIDDSLNQFRVALSFIPAGTMHACSACGGH